MNPNVTAVLLVPSPERAEALLRCGPCGARPPMAWLTADEDPRWKAWGEPDPWTGESMPAPDSPRARETQFHALVLAWGGWPVRDGLDRAEAVTHFAVYDGMGNNIVRALENARAYERDGFGRAVCLDAEGKEVDGG